jgi:hypothetical protein
MKATKFTLLIAPEYPQRHQACCVLRGDKGIMPGCTSTPPAPILQTRV